MAIWGLPVFSKGRHRRVYHTSPQPLPQPHSHQAASKRRSPAKLLAQLAHTHLQPRPLTEVISSLLPTRHVGVWTCCFTLTHHSLLCGSEPRSHRSPVISGLLLPKCRGAVMEHGGGGSPFPQLVNWPLWHGSLSLLIPVSLPEKLQGRNSSKPSYLLLIPKGPFKE